MGLSTDRRSVFSYQGQNKRKEIVKIVHFSPTSVGTMYCVLVFNLFIFVGMGIIIYDLVQDMENVFGHCKKLTAHGNYV